MTRYGHPGRLSPAPPEWIEISGFKSLRDPVRVHLRPLTLLAGANSSGKSSVMQPLLLMKQTLEASYDPGALLLDGPHVRFTRPDEFLSRGKRRSDFAKAVQVVFGPLVGTVRRPRRVDKRILSASSPAIRFDFQPSSRKKLDYGLDQVRLFQQVDGAWIELREGMSMEDFLRVRSGWTQGQGEQMAADVGPLQIHAFTERFSTRVTARPTREADEQRWPYYLSITPVEPHVTWLSSILHLPGLRGHRERRYEAARVSHVRSAVKVPGPFTAYVASMLVSWQDEKDARLEQVNESMAALGLTWKVHARRVSAAEVELKVGRTPKAQQGGASDLVSIADVGFGVSQVLPVVVALAAARKGQLVYVEQPELHLHPRAQYAMGGLLAAAAKRGVRVVVETHSRLLLRAIQVEVAQSGGLQPDQVGLHWFRRDPDTGTTAVDLAQLDESGAFGNWPVDFSDVEAKADDVWLHLAFGGDAG